MICFFDYILLLSIVFGMASGLFLGLKAIKLV